MNFKEWQKVIFYQLFCKGKSLYLMNGTVLVLAPIWLRLLCGGLSFRVNVFKLPGGHARFELNPAGALLPGLSVIIK
jgi:hypothetical protein